MTKRRSTPKRVASNKESYFDAERILDERKVSGKWMYLIKWTGHDRNGKPWSPDWQPKDNCTPMLLKEWEQEKLRRKRQEDQKNKENHKEKENQKDSNQEGNVMQDDDPVDLQDDKADGKIQMDIDKPDNKIVNDDNLKQVLDKYCHQNINDDHLKKKSQSLGPSTVKRDSNTSRRFNSLSFPTSKVKFIKLSPTITSNSPIKNNISILEPNNDETNSTDVFRSSSNKYSHGKKFQIPSRSERVSLINLNKRGLEDSNNNNNNSSAKRQRTDDVNRKINTTNSSNSSNSSEKVEESRILPTSNVKNKKIPSQTNNSSNNKPSSDGNSSNQQNIPVNNQNSNQSQAAIHVNSETIKALNSRKNSTKFRPIAAKITPPSPHTYVTSVASVSNIVNVYPPVGSGKKFNSMTSNRLSANRSAIIRNSAPVENSPKNSVSNNDSQNQVSDKNGSVPTTAPVQHTSYFHRPYVQATSASNTAPVKNSNVIQTNQPVDNQTTIVTQKSNKQPITPTAPITPTTPTTPTNERSNQNQSSNLQNSTAGSSTMEDNNDSTSYNRPFYQLPLDKLKEPTKTNIDLWMNEWVKATSLNDTLEKEKSDLLKEKNKYYKEVNQLRLEVERRPQTESETTETIKKCQTVYSKWLDCREEYAEKCKEYTKLESDHSKLQNEYNKIKKIVMTKHSEVETLKENLNKKTQELNELKEVKEESNRLKADWSRITKNGVIFIREDCAKITKLQKTLQELINQRSTINEEINKLRETISQGVDKMKEDDDEEDYEKLYQRIENLKLQNKLQGTSLKMAEDNSTIAEESAKLMLDLKRLTVEELLGKFDVLSPTVSYPSNSSNSQSSSSSSSPISIANLLNKSTDYITTPSNSTFNQRGTSEKMSLQSQNRDNQGVGTMRMPNVETRNLSQGNVSTNTNILQARNLTMPLIIARGNPNLAGNVNNFRRNSMTDTNSRTLPGPSTNSARVVQSNVVTAPSRGVRIPSNVTGITAMTAIPAEMNVRSYTSATETKSKVIVAKPKPKAPVKSIPRNNYFCEWDLCKRSFDDKVELKKHLKNDHFNSGTKYNGKDKVIDCTEVKIEV